MVNGEWSISATDSPTKRIEANLIFDLNMFFLKLIERSLLTIFHSPLTIHQVCVRYLLSFLSIVQINMANSNVKGVKTNFSNSISAIKFPIVFKANRTTNNHSIVFKILSEILCFI
jgi:hypothetical protein